MQVLRSPPMIEIERKFIVEEKPDFLHRFSCRRISQAYPFIQGSSHVRVRRKGYDFTAAMKSRENGETQEYEFDISAADFCRLWEESYWKVEKWRYDLDDLVELDFFKFPTFGVMLAEREFLTFDEAEAWVPPDWFGPEVTGDVRFNNEFIAIHGFPQ